MTTTDPDTPPTTDPDTASPATTAADLDALLAHLDNVLGGRFFRDLAPSFKQWDWAAEEIQNAQKRHPQHADLLFHAFILLQPNDELDRMRFELVYRAHCRELLDRVAAGEDTRPGTAAEICCALLETSQLAPLKSAAAGLYMRMWQAAGLPEIPDLPEASHHYEALEKSTIDDHERFARRKLTVADRRLGSINCCGLHDGEDVHCVYARSGLPASEV